jgi:hypothetical protein
MGGRNHRGLQPYAIHIEGARNWWSNSYAKWSSFLRAIYFFQSHLGDLEVDSYLLWPSAFMVQGSVHCCIFYWVVLDLGHYEFAAKEFAQRFP